MSDLVRLGPPFERHRSISDRRLCVSCHRRRDALRLACETRDGGV